MKNVIRIGSKRKPKVTPQEMALTSTLNSRVELIQGLIQGLIPIGLSAVGEVLKREVERLAGIKHGRQGGLPGHYRWGSQEGSSSSGSGCGKEQGSSSGQLPFAAGAEECG